MVSWEYPPHVVGGLGRHVHQLSRSLSSRNVDVTVLTFTDGSSPLQEEIDGVKIVRVNPYSIRYPDFISWIQGLNMLMVERANMIEDYDIIHAHDWLSAYAGIALKHLKRRPLVATIHSTERGRRGDLKNDSERHIHEMEWWLSYEAWNVICCSHYMMREVSSNLGCPAGKMTVIPNGYSRNSLGSPVTIKRSDFAGDDEKVVLFVGRMVYEKGPQLLLEAASRLNDLRLKFLFVGDGPMRSYLMDLSRRFGVDGRVYFTGYTPDSQLAALYKIASMAVFPSLYEPFGIVVLEAMGVGVPVIVSATGGLDEIVQDGFNGLKFIPGSPDSLAYQIRRMANNGGLSHWVIGNARTSVEKYSWDAAANSTMDVYSRAAIEYGKGEWKPTF